MTLSQNNIKSFVGFAEIENHKKTITIKYKKDSSPVTKIDKLIEKTFRNEIKKKYPGHGIYGEEFKNSKINNEYIWVIDPIDGTKNFIHGHHSFGTLITLLHHGAPIFGIINSPLMKKTWKAFKDLKENKIYNQIGKIIRYYIFGGDCVQYGLLAEGKIPMVAECDLKPFDFLPLVNLIEESGGSITDWRGNQLSLKSGGNVVASLSKKAHSEFIKISKSL